MYTYTLEFIWKNRCFYIHFKPCDYCALCVYNIVFCCFNMWAHHARDFPLIPIECFEWSQMMPVSRLWATVCVSEFVIGEHDSEWHFIWTLAVVISLALSADAMPEQTWGMRLLTLDFLEALQLSEWEMWVRAQSDIRSFSRHHTHSLNLGPHMMSVWQPFTVIAVVGWYELLGY